MNPFTQTQSAEPNAPTSRLTQREGCLAVPEDQRRKQEADRLFEARLQCFLTVSRTA